MGQFSLVVNNFAVGRECFEHRRAVDDGDIDAGFFNCFGRGELDACLIMLAVAAVFGAGQNGQGSVGALDVFAADFRNVFELRHVGMIEWAFRDAMLGAPAVVGKRLNEIFIALDAVGFGNVVFFAPAFSSNDAGVRIGAVGFFGRRACSKTPIGRMSPDGNKRKQAKDDHGRERRTESSPRRSSLHLPAQPQKAARRMVRRRFRVE